jgi:hypothetical protein|tara:strand:- start:335 stop:1363 length:1029 start_codon:yes stop_codon:yes gene_type:complete
MKIKILSLLVLITAFSASAQIDSLTISNLESKLTKQINQQKTIFNEKLSEIKTFQDSNHNKILNELSILTKSHKKAQLKLDSLAQEQLASNQRDLELKKLISSLENQLNNKVNGLKTETNQLGIVTSSLSEGLTTAKNDVSEIAESSSKNSNSIDTVNQALSQKQQYGLIFIGLFLILVLTIYIILTKRQNTDTKKLAKKQQEIFEKQIQDGQQLTDWLSKQTTDSLGKSSGGEIDHSFAKRVADEIVRITTNLSRMDATVKGHKQLSASVRKLEQSLNSNNYELEALLNKPYDNGMNLQANFVIDENLQEGESVITRIIKPQINYKGKLIQAAQVEVSQGE